MRRHAYTPEGANSRPDAHTRGGSWVRVQTPDEGEMKNAPGERFEWAGTDGTPPRGQPEALGRTHIGAREGGRPRRGEPPRERTELGGNPQSIVSYSMRESPFNNHDATWRVSWQVSY